MSLDAKKVKYHEGDTVEIVSAQKDCQLMVDMIGTIQIVEHFYCWTDNKEWYILEDNGYIWSEDWLKPINSFELNETDLIKLLKE